MYKNSKVVLFAFGTSDLKISSERIKKQAIDSKYYDEIKILSPKDFDKKMLKTINELIKNKKKKRLWLLVLETFISSKNNR